MFFNKLICLKLIVGYIILMPLNGINQVMKVEKDRQRKYLSQILLFEWEYTYWRMKMNCDFDKFDEKYSYCLGIDKNGLY